MTRAHGRRDANHPEQAIKAWNTRPLEDRLAAALAEKDAEITNLRTDAKEGEERIRIWKQKIVERDVEIADLKRQLAEWEAQYKGADKIEKVNRHLTRTFTTDKDGNLTWRDQ